MSRRNAFTLIELYVVLFILAAVIALLFPVHTHCGNRGKARRISCLSNMKQQGLALLMYAQDHDEHLPTNTAIWMDISLPYIKNEKALHCPSLSSKKEYGYAFDARMAGKNAGKRTDSEDTSLLLESTNTQKNAVTHGEGFVLRHEGAGNLVYADGHAKSIRQKEAINLSARTLKL